MQAAEDRQYCLCPICSRRPRLVSAETRTGRRRTRARTKSTTMSRGGHRQRRLRKLPVTWGRRRRRTVCKDCSSFNLPSSAVSLFKLSLLNLLRLSLRKCCPITLAPLVAPYLYLGHAGRGALWKLRFKFSSSHSACIHFYSYLLLPLMIMMPMVTVLLCFYVKQIVLSPTTTHNHVTTTRQRRQQQTK